MKTFLGIVFASALVLGLASTIVASAHPVRHTELMRNGHSDRAYPADTSHWLI